MTRTYPGVHCVFREKGDEGRYEKIETRVGRADRSDRTLSGRRGVGVGRSETEKDGGPEIPKGRRGLPQDSGRRKRVPTQARGRPSPDRGGRPRVSEGRPEWFRV